jgi:alkylated DNA repair protein (DNA oxidative demethylase)
MTLSEGLIYVLGFLTEAEERDLLAVLAAFELHPYVLHDTPSRRLVRSFGLALVTGAYDTGPAAPVPAELDWLKERCAALMGREPGELADLLVTRYPPGAGSAGTAMHRSSATSAASLQAACRMLFRRGQPRARQTAELTLEPRSAYVLSCQPPSPAGPGQPLCGFAPPASGDAGRWLDWSGEGSSLVCVGWVGERG